MPESGATPISNLTMNDKMSPFAHTIYQQKYAHPGEEWPDTAHRVASKVLGALGIGARSRICREVEELIVQRKFIPGGRYLFATGRPFHQVNNCFLFRAEDSREGWSDLMQKGTMSLMTGGGIGCDYSDVRPEGTVISRTGGIATGPTALMNMINESGRFVRQGGARRSAIWAGLNWKHPDIHTFITMKNWSPLVRSAKEKDFSFPAQMDGTNISVLLDDDFFDAIDDPSNPLHPHAHSVYWATIKQMLKTAEPGFSVDVGKNSRETLRNACVSGDTEILTKAGYRRIDSVVGRTVDVWNGEEWSTVTPRVTGHNQEMVVVTLDSGQTLRCTKNHTFWVRADYQGPHFPIQASSLEPGTRLILPSYPIIEPGDDVNGAEAYTQGFLSGDGMDGYGHFLVYPPKYGCIHRMHGKAGSMNTNGAQYFRLGFTPLLKSFVPEQWNAQSRVNWLAGLLDADGTIVKEGSIQLASVDDDFLLRTQRMLTTLGAYSKVTLMRGATSGLLPNGRGGYSEYSQQPVWRLHLGVSAVQTLVSLGLKCERLDLSKADGKIGKPKAPMVVSVEEDGVEGTVYCFTEPKLHRGVFNGVLTGQCTEITSRDDSDVCNLGSINLSRIHSEEEMERAVQLGTLFLLAGTVYSHVPFEKVRDVREKNRRLGLGLMGIHEWLLTHNAGYAPDEGLERLLRIYGRSGDIAAQWADKYGLSHPIKTRAIAPNGTIGIVGETTTSAEPLLCVAYKRRYLKHETWNYQYVVDPCAKRLIEAGVDPDSIEDAYLLAKNVEKRVGFQAWLQQYVDHGISSTINLPPWGSEENNEDTVQPFGKMLLKYLPLLRGVTCYPDGARGGQPLVPVKYATAMKHVGEVFEESADICELSGKGGTCG